MFSELFALSFLLIFILYITDRIVNRRKWKLLSKIPGPTAFPFIDSINDLLLITRKKIADPISYFFFRREGMCHLYRKEKMNILWVGRHPIVFLNAPETAEPFFRSTTDLQKGELYKYLKPWLAEGLILSHGDKWRRHRKLLTPSFHFRILDNFLPVMNEQAAILTKKIKEVSATKDSIDCFDIYAKCTLDVISETAMGIKFGAQDGDSTFSEMIHCVSYEISMRFNRPWLDSDTIYFMTKGGKRFREAVNYFHGVTDKVLAEKIAEKKRNPTKPDEPESEFGNKKRLAFLDLILETGLTSQEIREQVDTFIFAGQDTTSTALSWMTYLLGLHPDVQERLFEELDSVFQGDMHRHVTQEDLRNLKYMEQVMKESQRIYPSVPGVSRTVENDTLIGDYLIPKGTECSLSIYSIHHNPDHYPNPEVFDPERFSPENSAGRHPYAFVPFSAGARNCIGQKFALMEQKVIACHVLRQFRVLSLDPRDKIRLMPELVLKVDQEMRIKYIPRE